MLGVLVVPFIGIISFVIFMSQKSHIRMLTFRQIWIEGFDMKIRKNISIVVVLMAIFGATQAYAGKRSMDTGGGNQMAMMKAQQMMQQFKAEAAKANAELEKLRAENEKLAKENKKLEKALAKNQKKLNRTSGSLDNYKESHEKLKERLLTTQDKMQELIGRFRETIATLRGVEEENNVARKDLKATKDKLFMCANNNLKLYDTNMEILGKYEGKGVWDVLHQNEPLTQIRQVEIENMIQDYRDIMDELQVDKVALTSTNKKDKHL